MSDRRPLTQCEAAACAFYDLVVAIGRRRLPHLATQSAERELPDLDASDGAPE